jgi:predicted ABC-type ATPase
LGNTEIVGVIPARFASTRLPGKPLLSETGRPLIRHVVEAARTSSRLDRVIVATDDARRRAQIAEHADLIAAELAPESPERAALEAGRRMLARLEAPRWARPTFAFETTLAGRAYAGWLGRCLGEGYAVHLVFLWFRSPELAVQRVAQRVASSGHAIGEEVVRRRYAAGLRHLLAVYRPPATTRVVYDDWGLVPRLVAAGERSATAFLIDPETWSRMQEQAGLGAQRGAREPDRGAVRAADADRRCRARRGRGGGARAPAGRAPGGDLA